MKVLVIGGTKFIGKSIVDYSLKAGHEVVLFNRGETPSSRDLVLIKGDIENIIDQKNEILQHNFDIVVHCIAYTEKHAEDIRGILKYNKTKLIILSSCDSYETFQGLNRQVDKAELPINEDSPLSSMKYYWRDSTVKGSRANKYDKNLLTDILMDGYSNKEFNLIVFKLPLVFGPGDYQYPGRHGALIQRILDKKEDLILSDREQCQVYTYGYIDNIGAAIVFSFNKEICNGKIYNLGDDKSRTRRKWAEMYAACANWSFNYHIIPEELIRKDKSFRNAPPQHLLINSSLYARETGFKNPIITEDAIRRTFEYAKKHPDILGERPKYDEEEKLLSVYYSHLDKVYEGLNK